MAKNNSILGNINDAAKTVNNVKKAAKPPKKKKAKKTTTKTVYVSNTPKAASAPRAANTAGGAPAAARVNVVETLRIIEAEVENSGDAKAKKLFKKFTKATMKEKPNYKTGSKLMEKLGMLSAASEEIKKILMK